MHEWLTDAAQSLADAAGVDADGLELTDDEVDALLRLAGLAAHESGDRRNAPLLCYLVGRASAMGDVDVAAVAALLGRRQG